MTGATPPNGTDPKTPDRRQLLLGWGRWAAALAATLFVYPLLRFTGFQVPRKPRLVEVPAPLPLSGVHTGPDFLLFAAGDSARAVSRTCTHLGCRLNYQEDKGYIEVTLPEEPSLKPLQNGIVELSAHGVDLLEGSIPDDPGISI